MLHVQMLLLLLADAKGTSYIHTRQQTQMRFTILYSLALLHFHVSSFRLCIWIMQDYPQINTNVFYFNEETEI